jgi:hypothetical protein
MRRNRARLAYILTVGDNDLKAKFKVRSENAQYTSGGRCSLVWFGGCFGGPAGGPAGGPSDGSAAGSVVPAGGPLGFAGPGLQQLP